jgi:hypothetical protein
MAEPRLGVFEFLDEFVDSEATVEAVRAACPGRR